MSRVISKKSVKKKTSTKNDHDEVEDINIPMDLIKKTKKSIKSKTQQSLDKVEHTFSLIDHEEMKQIVEDSPEMMKLLDEYISKMKELRTQLQPLLEMTKSNDQSVETKEGISFLQLRFQILLSYCQNICFYMLLKTEGKLIENHPVIRRLVHMRIIIDKLRPVHNQLKYQIDKLLRSSAMSGSSIVKVASEKETDFMAFKPNIESFNETPEAQEIPSGKPVIKEKPAKNRLLGSTSFEQEERLSSRVAERKSIEKERITHSRLVKELRDELSDRPEEQSSIGTSKSRISALDRERDTFEEEHFMRLAETREVKKRRREAEQMTGFADVDDMEDLRDLINMDKRKNNDEEKALNLLRSRISSSRAHSSLEAANSDYGADFGDENDNYYDQFVGDDSKTKYNKGAFGKTGKGGSRKKARR